jgi:hypothetical protein
VVTVVLYLTSKIPLRLQELVRDPRVGYSEEDLVGPLAFQVSEPSMTLDSGSGYPTAGPLLANRYTG